MQKVVLILLLAAVLAGCATQEPRHAQCGRMSFRNCLDVDASQCDALFDKARTSCQQKQAENTMFDAMPDTMKENHLARCMVDDVVTQSGLPADKTKGCLRW